MIGRRGRAVSGAFVFLLLAVFAVFAVVLVLLGARAYQTTVARSEAHAAGRVLESYVVNAVRADDAAGAVSIENIGGMDALRIAYDYDGEAYDKWIYCHDGSLRELFTSADYEFDAGAGEPVCDAKSMQILKDGRKIIVATTDMDGREHRAVIALRCPS